MVSPGEMPSSLRKNVSRCPAIATLPSTPGRGVPGTCPAPRIHVVSSTPWRTTTTVSFSVTLHLSKPAIMGGMGGMIPEGVLVANAACNVAPDFPQVVEGIRKVRMPAAQVCDLPKHAGIPVEISVVIDADGVD